MRCGRRRRLLAVIAVAIAMVSCRGGSERAKRTGSAAPVEVVTQPQLPDAGSGPGPNADEIEPNDGEDVASPIALGGTARGKIEPESDADYYRLDVDKAGVLQVVLSGVEGDDLTLELVDATGTSLGKSERAGARIKEGIPNAGVTPGRYTLIVKQTPKKKPKRRRGRKAPPPEPAGPAPVYELSAQLITPAKGGEREPNGDRGTANDLIVGDTASGFVGWSGDEDVWKLSTETLSDKNALDIEIAAIEGVALTLEVADGIGNTLVTRKAPRGQPLRLRGLVPVVKEGAPPFHYLTVAGDRSNPETSYMLHAAAEVLGLDPELEPNDSLENAQPIPADRTVVHAQWSPGDLDHFSLATADVARTVDVTIDTPAELDLAIEVFVDGTSVASANKGKKGAVEKVTAVAVPPGAVTVIRVRNVDARSTVEASYDVSVQEATATDDNAP